jgi:hypothetical protein
VLSFLFFYVTHIVSVSASCTYITMGCGSSKKAEDGTEMARPAPAGGDSQPPGPTHINQNERDVSPGSPNPAQNRTTEKVPTNPENPVVFFDITIGGLYSIWQLFLVT